MSKRKADGEEARRSTLGSVLTAPQESSTAAAVAAVAASPSQPGTTTQSLPNVSDIQLQGTYDAHGLPYTGSPSQQPGSQQGLNIMPGIPSISDEKLQKMKVELQKLTKLIRGTCKIADLRQLEDFVPSFDSRILVVGAYEAGKTTLVSNLIGKAIPRERQCTDGIDVYFGKLLFDLKKQKLLKQTKGVHSFPKAIYQKMLSSLKAMKQEDVKPDHTQLDIPNHDILQKLSDKILEYEDADSEEWFGDHHVIPIPVLDFAGQIVYHATHQTFISSHGIYIITFNGSKELDNPLSDKEDERKTTILGKNDTGFQYQ